MKTRILTISASIAIVSGAWMSYSWVQQGNQEAVYSPVEAMDSKARNWNAAEDYYKSIRANQNTGDIKLEWVEKAEKEIARMGTTGSRAVNMVWEEIGPENIGGRTRAILVDPTNSNRMYAGSAGGGLFVSDDAGGRWSPINDMAPSLLISCLAQAPNGDIYAGTGCSFEGSSDGPGKGIYKSTDGGTTFTQLPSTIPVDDNSNNSSTQWIKINDITVDPSNSSNVFAATANGLRVSTDGGATWANPIYIDPNCTIEATGTAMDLAWGNNGRLLVVLGGGVFYSDSPTVDCQYTKVAGTVLPGSSQRMAIAVSASNPDKVYGISVAGGQLQNLYVSNDNAVTWAILNPGPPLTDPDFNLFGDNGQGNYDLAIVVDPVNDQRIFIAGVQMYRFDGNWTRASGEFLSEFSPFYVHSDKHFFTFDPNNPNILYIGHDGGITKSTDAGNSFFTANRGYNVTQFYDVAARKDGLVMGGTQDNGTNAIDATVPGQSKDGFEVTGGDGFDCAFSNINDAIFTTVQYGDLRRGNGIGSNFAAISGAFGGEGIGPFNSTIRLWENENDLTSKDSIPFINDTNARSLGTGDGTKRNFVGTLNANQEAGDIVPGSLVIDAGLAFMADANGDGAIDAGGDGTGTLIYNTDGSVDFDIVFDVAPNLNLIVESRFAVSFSAGDTLNFQSITSDLPVKHVLTANLLPGDEIKVQDPIQSLLALGTNTAIAVTRDGLRFSETPLWVNITASVPNFGTTTCMEYSNDGDILYAGTRNGAIYRITGLNEVYDLTSAPPSITQIFSGSQAITGMSLHPTNSQILAFTRGNWGNPMHVHMIDDAASRTTSATQNSAGVSKQGDLPAMPVYDCQIDVNEPNIVLIGTAYGVFATDNIFASAPTWTSQNATFANTEVQAITQQRLPYNEASNDGVYYLGTHGRGLWKSSTLVSTQELPEIADGPDFLASLNVYPNPMSSIGVVGVTSQEATKANFRVFSLQGQLVESKQVNLTSGSNNIQIDVNSYPVGTYLITLEAEGSTKMTKLVVTR